MATSTWTEIRDNLRTLYAGVTSSTPFPIKTRIGDKSFDFETPEAILNQLERVEKIVRLENPKRVRRLYLGNGGRG